MPTAENRQSNENLWCFPAAPKEQFSHFTGQGTGKQNIVACKAAGQKNPILYKMKKYNRSKSIK
jgi:hypothetical protein